MLSTLLNSSTAAQHIVQALKSATAVPCTGTSCTVQASLCHRAKFAEPFTERIGRSKYLLSLVES
jgi:hypothetical protein